MFETGPNLWLQSWAVPWLTTTMNVVSILGYSHCCLAVAALVTFGWRLRSGIALVVMVALTAVLVSLAKTEWAAPRPDAVDPRVQQLTIYQLRSARDVAPRADDENRFGFPSGHVAITTALVFGVGLLARRRWVWAIAAMSVVLMAVSRMYLGRHFLGDVLGGLALGVIAVAFGWYGLGLRRLAASQFEADRRVGAVLVLLAAAVIVLSLAAGTPASYDAGRLFGVSLATALILRTTAPEPRSVLERIALLLLSLLLIALAVVWDVAPHRLAGAEATGPVRLLLAATLNGAALWAPISILRLSRP